MFQDHKIAYVRKNVKIRKAEPLSFLRQSVAFALVQQARNVPHASMTSYIDCTELVQYGKKSDGDLRRGVEPLSDKLLLRRAIRRNFSAFFLKALAHSLHHTPRLNGFLDYTPLRNGGTYYEAEDINVSYTVNTKKGVVAPVLYNAHQKPLEQVASEMRILARKARRTDPEELYYRVVKALTRVAIRELDIFNIKALIMCLRYALKRDKGYDPELLNVPMEDRLQVSDIFGGTVTLANIGMMIPGFHTVNIVPPPGVMMFGIGDLHLAPRVVNGEIVPRYVIALNGTMDHRAFDGGDGFPVRDHFQRYCENPRLLYDWKPGDAY